VLIVTRGYSWSESESVTAQLEVGNKEELMNITDLDLLPTTSFVDVRHASPDLTAGQ
jgi:hypothetical protein